MYWIFDRPYADPVRLPLANGPVPMALILTVYLTFVLKLGPRLMANRPAFKLNGVLKFYNLMQIAYNSVLLSSFLYFIYTRNPFDFRCPLLLPQDHPFKHMDRMFSYCYYINKIIDLLDTIFFVLRKSYKQVTLLHLVHHVFMTGGGYLAIRFYGYNGQLLVMGILNLLVHIIMYSYYYLSSQSAAIKRSLWWKQYITIIQLLQFVIVFLHSVWTLVQPDCKTHLVINWMSVFMTLLMFVMFSNFYIHAYILPKQSKSCVENKQKASKHKE